MVDVEAIPCSVRCCAVKLFSVCATLVAALVFEEKTLESGSSMDGGRFSLYIL